METLMAITIRNRLDGEDLDRLMTEAEAAEILCYSVRALQNWRVRGGGPKFIKVSSRSVRYRRRDLLAWIDQRTRNHTSEEAA